MPYVLVVGGLACLAAGGELLVRGSVAVAERLGMSPLLIGLTLVGFGTSMPELATSVQAALAGSPGIAIGNVVGSNISNILLVLGLAALIAPVAVSPAALRRDGLVMAASAFAFATVGFLHPLDRPVGVTFLVLLAVYVGFAYWQEGRGPSEHSAAYEKAAAYDELHTGPIVHQKEARSFDERLGPALPILMAIAGLVIVVLGGKLLVDGAVQIAREAAVPETIIGLTIVAIGTSMPEFVTSLVAAYRKHGDVAVGNIMGSCIYNVLGIGGVTAIMAPGDIPSQIARFDNLVMVAASLAMVGLAGIAGRIGRLAGFVLVASYLVYLAALWPT